MTKHKVGRPTKLTEVHILNREKLSNYRIKFDSLKKEFLHYKFNMEQNLDDHNSLKVRRRLGKIANLLFEIDAEFIRDHNQND